MTREEAIEFGNMWLQINEDCKDSNTYAFFQMAIKALEQCEVWNGIHGQIVVPKGTFDKIWNDTDKAESEDKV